MVAKAETPMYEALLTVNTILYCKRWRETVRYYRDRLRLPVIFFTDWFVEFALTETSRLSVADERRASIKSSAGDGITISLQVKNIENMWEYAKNAGLEPTEIRRHAWNAEVFYLFDPEGHRIEFWQSAERADVKIRG